ncbi:MAG: hypothetical protein V4651_07580 [Bacteroidota bacterium]
MKWTTIILLIGLTACNIRTDKTVPEEKFQTVHVDSFHVDNKEIIGAGGQPYKKLFNCNFDRFIADKKTPKLAKNIYLGNKWNLRNDNTALALLDSLTAKNKQSRPFYFKVVTLMYKKSDGYFSEALGLAGKEYIENNTKEFIANFDYKNCFTNKDLTTWADIVILEFSLSGQGEYNKSIIDSYIKKLKSNCKECSPTQKENIHKFGLTLQNEWRKFMKNTAK